MQSEALSTAVSIMELTGANTSPINVIRSDSKAYATPKSEGSKDVQSAVYAHVRALRALGKTTVNSADIARSLGLSIREVESALIRLEKKGIKMKKRG
jgi:predicted Rossmann fold nucleotide-binding protein DprA/Smf involved in DNA uptake